MIKVRKIVGYEVTYTRSTYGKNLKFSISLHTQAAVIFYSETMMNLLDEIIDIQFDGTFYTVPVQFLSADTLFDDIQKSGAVHCIIE